MSISLLLSLCIHLSTYLSLSASLSLPSILHVLSGKLGSWTPWGKCFNQQCLWAESGAPLGTSVPRFSSCRVELALQLLGVLEFLSRPRHRPPAQGCNKPATCGGRPSGCRAWAVCASPSPSSHSQSNHGPPCGQRTEGEQAPPMPRSRRDLF